MVNNSRLELSKGMDAAKWNVKYNVMQTFSSYCSNEFTWLLLIALIERLTYICERLQWFSRTAGKPDEREGGGGGGRMRPGNN